MKKVTLKALQGSIEKWEAIVAGTGADYAVENCPLCTRFYDREDDRSCVIGREKCPVYKRTGLPRCMESPYDKWSRLTVENAKPRRAETKKQIAAAQAELAFLRSLLPKAPK